MDEDVNNDKSNGFCPMRVRMQDYSATRTRNNSYVKTECFVAMHMRVLYWMYHTDKKRL